MLNDVLAWSRQESTGKIISKETLNHRGLIELVSGLDVYTHTVDAYFRAYDALGIDIINRAPLINAPEPTPIGQVRKHVNPSYERGALGVYDTIMRRTYACATPEDVWELDVTSWKYEDLIVPVPHPCDTDDVQARQQAIGSVGFYYPMLYTTLFMWPIEVLGWEVFMIAAATEPGRFHEHFLVPCAAKSKMIIDRMVASSDSPFIFVHDDLAVSTGPAFAPKWYDDYIFPHYPSIWKNAKEHGKKIIFVADGDMTSFLPKLVESGVDGLMFETPATPLEAVKEHFGSPGQFIIGGISTSVLTLGRPNEVTQMVKNLYQEMADIPGWAIASGGGLHGNIPLKNLEAYFDARQTMDATPANWRTRCKSEKRIT